MIQQARRLRKTQTRAERRLWSRLRDRRFLGCKFRRQCPIPPFIADFVCEELKLIIEVDGGYHALSRVYDAYRTAYLNRLGYQVVRYWNSQVLNRMDDTLESLAQHVFARQEELGIARGSQPGVSDTLAR